MIIKYFKQETLNFLKKKAIDKNIKYYKGDNSWLFTEYNCNNMLLAFNKKEFKDIKLKFTEGNIDDFENMKLIYESLKDLTDSQASDERVWAGLAHTYFWDYMQKRWPLPSDITKQKNHILNNYFFWNSTKAVFLNGISRLWWYARFTYDENLDDPYELTKYICDNDINGKIFPLLSCVFASNKEVFKNIIKAIKEYEEVNNLKLTRDQFNDLKKYLNRLSGKIVMDILTLDDFKIKIFNQLDKIISGG